jgi:hypothetical protein
MSGTGIGQATQKLAPWPRPFLATSSRLPRSTAAAARPAGFTTAAPALPAKAIKATAAATPSK